VKWVNLVGKRREQPAAGRWHDWKQAIADFCEGRCVYCAIHEGRFGGIRNFHIEHFRPKVRFPDLEDAIANLYLACAICNVLKCDDWPAEPSADHSTAAYLDPASVDYNAVLSVIAPSYEVSSETMAGRYLIQRILLNRAQLVLERRLSSTLDALENFETWVTTSMDVMTDKERTETVAALLKISGAKTAAIKARPYRDQQTKRLKAKARKKR
jgi:hypothetical protein